MRFSRSLLPERGLEVLLLMILILKLLLIIPVLANPAAVVTIDSIEYLEMADTIAERGSYHDPANPERDLVRPPGYPLILFLIGSVLGDGIHQISMVQLIVQGLTCWAVLWIGKKMAQPTVGLVAAWLYASSPNATLWSLTVMTEVWLALLMALAMALALASASESGHRWPSQAGALLGLASYVRPIAVTLLPVWAALTFLWRRLKGAIWHALRSLVILALSMAIIMAPWVIRNRGVHDQVVFSTVGEKTWVGFNLAEVVAVGAGIDRNTAVSRIDTSGGLAAATWNVMQAYPLAFLRVMVLGIARTVVGTSLGTWGNLLGYEDWLGLGLLSGFLTGQAINPVELIRSGWLGPGAPLKVGLMLTSFLHTLVLFGLAALGLISSGRLARGELISMQFAAATAAVLIITPMAAGQARFRVPAEPLLGVMAGFGWMTLMEWNRQQSRPGKVDSGMKVNAVLPGLREP